MDDSTTMTATISPEPQTLREMLGEPERRENERHPDWPKVRRSHLETQSFCFACGSTSNLEVHHIKPFKDHPSLELDEKNLITLCTRSAKGGMNCHLMIGHNGSWHDRNVNVVEDARRSLKRLNNALYRSQASSISKYIACHPQSGGTICEGTILRLIESGIFDPEADYLVEKIIRLRRELSILESQILSLSCYRIQSSNPILSHDKAMLYAELSREILIKCSSWLSSDVIRRKMPPEISGEKLPIVVHPNLDEAPF